MTTVFTDRKTGTPLFTCEIGDVRETEIIFETVRRGVKTDVQYRGMAAAQTPSYFFENGGSFMWQNTQGVYPGKVDEEGVLFIPFCPVQEQMDTAASKFLGQNVQGKGYYNLGAKRSEKLQKEGGEQLQKNYQSIVQASSFSQVPIQVNVTSWIMDGGIGVYPYMVQGAKKTLYCALWRLGMETCLQVQGMLGFGQPGISSVSWEIPVILYMVSEEDPNEEDLKRIMQFSDTLTPTAQLSQFMAQLEAQNRQSIMQEAARRAQETQAAIDQSWAMHNAAWARVEAQRDAMSADLDRFRAGLNQQMAANDAWRDQMFTPTPSAFNPSESMDDRIQRMRHESMMGVNTFDREDGTSYEHTIMNDRVFENNLDSNVHFGTENWYGDNIPDGWTELLRRK